MRLEQEANSFNAVFGVRLSYTALSFARVDAISDCTQLKPTYDS